jgi:hypothetical protein
LTKEMLILTLKAFLQKNAKATSTFDVCLPIAMDSLLSGRLCTAGLVPGRMLSFDMKYSYQSYDNTVP